MTPDFFQLYNTSIVVFRNYYNRQIRRLTDYISLSKKLKCQHKLREQNKILDLKIQSRCIARSM